MRKEFTLIALGALTAASGMFGSQVSAKEKQQEPAAPKEIYSFRRSTPTQKIAPYSLTFYTCDRHDVNTLRGEMLTHSKDTIANFQVSPTGISYTVVLNGKKGSKAAIYDINQIDKRIKEFDVKKYGNPTAACYLPDGRTMLIAAGDKIYVLDTRKYNVIGQIDNVPVTPREMLVSSNGYFLTVAGDDKVVVYNYETKEIRKTLDLGEKVTDMSFNPDNTDFAVLTADCVLSIYSTRTFDLRKMIDNLGEGRAFAYNFDGKYISVATSDDNIALVNLLRDSDRQYFPKENGGVCDVCFIPDAFNNTIMGYPTIVSVDLQRMPMLKPYYNKLISEEVDRKMDEWLKMMPGETMEQYKARVTDETRRQQRQLFEDEISTGFAGDLLDGMGMSLGSYDRSNGVLALNFDSMPTIYVPVPEADVTSFTSANDLRLSDVQYGILPDDSFEVVYAKITNVPTQKTYIYDNHNRASLDHIDADDAISIELLQQQQMEEIKLQELREKVVREAKSSNVISDHTNISVNSKVVPDYDANGNKILNYNVSVTYDVEPEFSAVEDFGPGKYHVNESGAATSMLKIVKEAFEGDLKEYLAAGKKVRVVLKGTADASPILRGIPYDGAYGDIDNEPVYKDGQLTTISVNSKDGIKENDQLALLRALGVKDYLEKNVNGYNDMNTDYRYEVTVSKDKGSAFRRITADFTFVDAF